MTRDDIIKVRGDITEALSGNLDMLDDGADPVAMVARLTDSQVAAIGARVTERTLQGYICDVMDREIEFVIQTTMRLEGAVAE